MRKLLLGIMGLFVASVAQADVISLNTISADSSPSTFNSNFTTIANVINGETEGSGTNGSTKNIKADSLGELDFADEINPRVRDAELLGVTDDSTTAQNSFVYSGCVPADDTDLTSDISACVAYVNGYRVSKSATSTTYTANMDNYVDLSQSGSYTVSTVTIGASAPSVASNSARIAKVTTDGTQIDTVTDLANRRLPGLVTPAQYRDGLIVSRDSATTLTVFPGTAEINNSMITSTTTTTLTITTAGDWAGGSALNAANTYGFVGLDTTGALKMHTTAPTHANYAVSSTVGKKRYATWSSTVYRILGWFFMDTASTIQVASNIKEGGVSNTIMSQDGNVVNFSSTSLSNIQSLPFYNSGGNILVMDTVSADSVAGGVQYFSVNLARSSTSIPNCGSADGDGSSVVGLSPSFSCLEINRPQGTVTYNVQGKVDQNSVNLRARNLVIQEQ